MTRPTLTERSWNGLRFAEKALDSGIPVRVFLFSDAVYVARQEQQPPEGAPNIEELLLTILKKGGVAGVCTTCVEARPYEPSQVSWPGVSSAHMLAEDPACLYNPLR